ncbi:MAG: transaldolase [Candidatus Dadabacteria bacterium]|nr:MAG: transaldolase [Candidatus Dadabacteria bacterium]
MPKNRYLEALREIGQSIWYDNLSRDVLASGELAKIIEQGVSGLTSNPTIFNKAIVGSTHYESQLKELTSQGLSPEEICDALMIEDVREAARLLTPVYEETEGLDGYASIEVSPLLARDTESTIKEAKRIFGELNMPNIMIKVPATSEGIPAIETLISEGVNVNCTLIFSCKVYKDVMDAYIAGIRKRAEAGHSLSVASVASFFVSRVDAACEKFYAKLVERGEADPSQEKEFLGKVGIANSKIAYNAFEETFSSDTFNDLKNQGASLQRPLWASTGTKNPAFSPILYVEELAGRNTVNTLPPKTLFKLMEGATIEPRLHSGLEESRELIRKINSMGIPFDNLLVELEKDGVEAFANSYRSLVNDIEKKVDALKG